MQLYCLKCKTKTETKNEMEKIAKNNRPMIHGTCEVCGRTKTSFVKMKNGGKLDIHKQILKIAPKKGFLVPGYNYCGPGNPLPNGPPVNELDQICMEHDYDYEKGVNKTVADKKMLSRLSKHKGNTLGEKMVKGMLVRPLIQAKAITGLGANLN